jgi:hypothetical protein
MKVKELIEKLQRLDPEMHVVIRDADTGWCLDLTQFREGVLTNAGTPWALSLGGDYDDVVAYGFM